MKFTELLGIPEARELVELIEELNGETEARLVKMREGYKAEQAEKYGYTYEEQNERPPRRLRGQKGNINMKKQYVIAPYMKGQAMYEADDWRLEKYADTVKGEFEKTKSVKGTVNGFEIGIFQGENGEKFVVFTDHTVRRMEA